MPKLPEKELPIKEVLEEEEELVELTPEQREKKKIVMAVFEKGGSPSDVGQELVEIQELSREKAGEIHADIKRIAEDHLRSGDLKAALYIFRYFAFPKKFLEDDPRFAEELKEGITKALKEGKSAFFEAVRTIEKLNIDIDAKVQQAAEEGIREMIKTHSEAAISEARNLQKKSILTESQLQKLVKEADLEQEK